MSDNAGNKISVLKTSAQNMYNIKLVVIYVLPSDNKFIKSVIACYLFWLSLTMKICKHVFFSFKLFILMPEGGQDD